MFIFRFGKNAKNYIRAKFTTTSIMHPDYECVRCGHKTHRKSGMSSHFQRKRECHPVLSKITLTDEIKLYILNHYVYATNLNTQTKQPSKITTNNNVNVTNNNINYNITINCINNMTLDKKIELMINHMGMTIEPLDECIQKKTQMFIENQGEVRSIEDLKSLAHYICKTHNENEIFNPVYMKRDNICSIMNEDLERITKTPLACLKSMLTILQEQTSGEYEIELVKNHESGMRGSREAIVDLYSFYKDVGIIPYVDEMCDARISKYGDRHEYTISERHMRIFNNCKKTKNGNEFLTMMKSFCNVSLMNDIILKSAKNSDELNSTISAPS
jgi:hypothetical protein